MRPSQLRLLALIVVVGAPTYAEGQAVGISLPPTVADETYISDKCVTIANEEPARGLADALQRARDACAVYARSPRDRDARDAWVRALMAIQNDVGASAVRTFMPGFSGDLPADLESYSLFLFPDGRWRDPPLSDRLPTLWSAFFNFGRSIGDRHAAIWFLDGVDGNVDVERSQEYCRRFGLNYNDGPYVVFARKRPDLLVRDDEIVIIRMGGIAPERVLAVLNRLSQDLATTGNVGAGALVFEEIRQRLLTLATPDGVRAFVSVVLGL